MMIKYAEVTPHSYVELREKRIKNTVSIRKGMPASYKLVEFAPDEPMTPERRQKGLSWLEKIKTQN